MSGHTLDSSFKDRVDDALEQDFLLGAVRFTTNRLRDGRDRAVAQEPEFEAWRDSLSAARRRALSNLDSVIETFATRAQAHGTHVHFAADAAEACEIVVEIARASSVKLAAKGKSMLSEEIGLNDALEAACIEALETDLGEWIIQLAGERPSHIILPVIHKSRGDIRELFEAHKGGQLTDDTATLAGYAREQLRTEFLRADMGITGCNIAIAEAGAVALFSNEGNGRMVSTLPRVHVALMGVERIIENVADFADLVRLLPRSATGQDITTYVNVLQGPARSDEHDGPRELHVVVVDAGRTAQLASPDFHDALACIRCGACLNVCPVYSHVGGHAYGTVYPGPIGAVLEPLFSGDDEQRAELANASTLCGACYEVCPVRIPLHDMLVSLRARNVDEGYVGGRELAQQKLASFVMASPSRYSVATRIVRAIARPLNGEGAIARFGREHAPGVARQLRHRAWPQIPRKSFRQLWRSSRAED